MKTFKTAVTAIAALTIFLATGSVVAADFPVKEIKLVVPWNVGGSNDISARLISKILADDGITVVVDNVAGATGTIGMTKVANAEPDGYTIGMGTSSTMAMIAQGLTPLKNEQFAPIARVTTDQLLLLVPKDSPTKDLDSFEAMVKKKPGKISIGTPGSNNLNHIFAVMTGNIVNSEIITVPYTGGSKVIIDLAGKQLDAAVLKPSESKAQIDANMVMPLGVFANERIKSMPNVPTFKEKGYNVFPYGPLVQMAYLAAPAKTPPEIQEKLIAIFSKAIQDPRFKAASEDGGARVDNLTGKALGAEIIAVTNTLAVVGKKVFSEPKK
ncbi:tripartite tricarboxylate transporter substrate binding protein [Polynucleobacter sp. 73C-SIWE]|jgi:tripartite-type tricarboxylate transporter receptor subunit TctC|uniref:Bug family tripartite tricarboxylate transporter substrate binding protein n=1 Tax=Polynucleobacter sp. 73C-SIWE TaxID=2689098 RepID=UPI001C0CB780|nr:tripartite tricarboxylate transporter substrate binding protein [Polynucleobacter sp. 73C-SIWE]MBU3579379.1 tripartite tricarboxylate transporter substrate binding protein [Polynucleobacter sp. 73C-SIWE]